MFDFHCHVCERRYLVGPGSISSFHNTSEGPIAYVRCPAGHYGVRRFRSPGLEDAALDGPVVDDPAHDDPALDDSVPAAI